MGTAAPQSKDLVKIAVFWQAVFCPQSWQYMLTKLKFVTKV